MLGQRHIENNKEGKTNQCEGFTDDAQIEICII